MRERLSNILRIFTAALTDAALSMLAVVLMLSLYDMERTVHAALGLWTLMLLAQAVINEFLAERSPSMLLYILVNAALVLACRHTVLENTVFVPGSMGFPMLLGMLVVIAGAHGAFAAHKLPGSDFFVTMTDTLVVSTGLYLFAAFSMGRAFHMPVLFFVLAAFALLMITTASLRAGGESDSVIRGTGVGGWLVLGALLIFCLAFTGALLSLGSGHVNSLVDVVSVLWQAFVRLMTACLKALAYVLALFIRPVSSRREYAVSDSAPMPELAVGEAEPTPAWLSWLIFALIAALLLAALAAIIWALHHTKFSRRRTKRKRRRVERRSHFFPALWALIARVASRIRFELAFLLARRTPQGLLVLAQRTGALHRLPRKKSESGGAYLRRLHGVLLERQENSSLSELAGMLDLIFYGGGDVRLTRAQYEAYAQQIRKIRLPSAIKETDKKTDKETDKNPDKTPEP